MPNEHLTKDVPLHTLIEGILFYKAEPMKKDALATFFEVTKEDIDRELTLLSERLASGATRLVLTDTAVQLVASSEVASTIDRLKKEESRSDIGRAGAETLAIILYRGPLSRAEIDRIRGVNSTFILRNLMVRGLIERREHPTDARSFTYAATPTLLNHLGITRKEDMPDYAVIMDALDAFEKEEVARDASIVEKTRS